MRRVFRFIGALLLVAAIASSGGVLSAPKTVINLVTAGDSGRRSSQSRLQSP
jgi:hypothetical protein